MGYPFEAPNLESDHNGITHEFHRDYNRTLRENKESPGDNRNILPLDPQIQHSYKANHSRSCSAGEKCSKSK